MHAGQISNTRAHVRDGLMQSKQTGSSNAYSQISPRGHYAQAYTENKANKW